MDDFIAKRVQPFDLSDAIERQLVARHETEERADTNLSSAAWIARRPT